MGAGLDQYLVAEITKRFKGRLVVVLNLEDSGAILIGDTREDYWGRTFAPRTVSVLDKDGRVVLWSAPVDYRRGWWSWQPRLTQEGGRAVGSESEEGHRPGREG